MRERRNPEDLRVSSESVHRVELVEGLTSFVAKQPPEPRLHESRRHLVGAERQNLARAEIDSAVHLQKMLDRLEHLSARRNVDRHAIASIRRQMNGLGEMLHNGWRILPDVRGDIGRKESAHIRGDFR